MPLNKLPKISVIVPYYNPIPSFFEDAINSIFAQSYQSWEVLIINDGSSTESTTKLHSLFNKANDERIKIIEHKTNQGVSAAKNTGIYSAKGEIITFLDADDRYFPWYFQKIINLFDANENCLITVTPTVFQITKNNKEEFFLKWFISNLIYNPDKIAFPRFIHHNLLIREEKEKFAQLVKSLQIKLIFNTVPRFAVKKEIFKKVKFDPELTVAEDLDLCLQILNTPEFINNTLVLPSPNYAYRVYSSKDRLTQKVELIFKSRTGILSKYSAKDGLANKYLTQWKRNFDWRYCEYIANFLKNGDLITFIKKVFENSPPKEKKLKTLRLILDTVIKHKMLTQILGLDLRQYEIPSKYNHNITSIIKESLNRFKNNHHIAQKSSKLAHAKTLQR